MNNTYKLVMNVKSKHERAKILRCLVEGNSIKSTTRITGVAKNTVIKLLIDVGRACEAYQDINLRKLDCRRLEVDEIWSFVYSKNKNTPTDRKNVAGDVYTWTALDPNSKLLVSWMVGTREKQYADAFMRDLASRLNNRIQLTTDGLKSYPDAVELAFGDNIDYARTVKNTSKSREEEIPFIVTQIISGKPNLNLTTNNHVERHNRTLRSGMRRFTRETDGFSKKIENHACMIALFMMYYNYVRIHQSLRVTPAMASGVTNRLWDLEDIVDLMDWEFYVT